MDGHTGHLRHVYNDDMLDRYVWKLGFTHAAGILNVFWGVAAILQALIVDTIMGNYWMLLISSMAYSAGLGISPMPTPPVLAHSMGTCSEYAPECVGEGQKMLLYAALAFIAIGIIHGGTVCARGDGSYSRH